MQRTLPYPSDPASLAYAFPIQASINNVVRTLKSDLSDRPITLTSLIYAIYTKIRTDDVLDWDAARANLGTVPGEAPVRCMLPFTAAYMKLP